MLFEFDEAKRRSNRAKHGIDFVEAQALWLDEMLIKIPARTEDEARFVVIGLISVRGSRDEEVALYEG